MAKRKRKLSREAIQFQTGEPLLYGSKYDLPRLQERVPRSMLRPIMPARRAGMTLPLAQRFERVQLRRKPLVSSTPLSSNFSGVFRFRSPFFGQYKQLIAAGQMVRNPKRVLFCVKRKLRREVLFAFRKVGFRGSSGGRRRTYRRNVDSLHGC